VPQLDNSWLPRVQNVSSYQDAKKDMNSLDHILRIMNSAVENIPEITEEILNFQSILMDLLSKSMKLKI